MRKKFLGIIFDINMPQVKKQGKAITINILPNSFANLKE